LLMSTEQAGATDAGLLGRHQQEHLVVLKFGTIFAR
jgi:hypothetical protein